MNKFLVVILMTCYSLLAKETLILAIHSYHELYPWTQSQRIGFRAVLNNAPNLSPLFSVEYLDTKRRTFDSAYETKIALYMKSKYQGYQPELIYVTDDNALNFIIRNQNTLFPGVPVVFSGINDLSKKETLDGNLFTGIYEKKEILPNLRLIKTLFPDEQEVLLIGDGSLTAQSTQRDVERDTVGYREMNVRFVNDQNFESVLNRLKGYKGKAVILTTVGGFRTDQGELIPLGKVINRIVKRGSFVVMSLEDTYIQQGVTGGYAVDGISQGTEAGKLALQILLHPESPLPKVDKNTNDWIFDAEVLQREAIPLPEEIAKESRFLNTPKTFFQNHQGVIVYLLYGLSAVIILGSLSFSWYLYRSRKIIAERQLSLSRLSESLNQAQKIAHLGNWEWDIQTNSLWWSDEIYRIFGLKPQEFQATYEAFLEQVYPDDRKRVEEAVKDTLNHHLHYSVVHRIVKQDGTVRHVLEEGNLIRDDLGNPLKMTGIVHDITEEYEKEEALQLSEKKYRDLVENAMIGVYRSDLFGNILYVNQALAGILGFDSPEELIGQNSVLRYSDSEQRVNFIQKLFQEHHVNNYEMELLDKHSALVPVMVSATVEGNIFSGMIIDMRELKKSREEIDKLSKVIEQIDDTVVITNKYGIITYVNEAFSRHTGYTKEYILGKTPRILKSNKHEEGVYRELWEKILKGDVFRGTIVNVKKNGDLYYENKTITPLKDEKNSIIGFVSSGKDVTQERLLQQEIERIATIDKLTGLCNRHKFEELFVLEAERSHRFSLPLSMIMIDIDHFKSVNDTYGHDIGDEVLKHLSKVVQANIRKIDIFARWGGEEFLILCPGTDLKYTRKLAEKLCGAVDNTLFPEVNHVTISLGIATFEKGDTFLELFKRADQGLYSAKDHGRNQVGSIASF